MIYTDLTKKAIEIAFRAHEGQVDKAGWPYVLHPVHLAEQMNTEDECVVALLHDVVEDSDITFEELEKEGFTEVQLEALRLLTREKDEPDLTKEEKDRRYFEYVERIGKNPIAKAVKMADLTHNMDKTRLSEITEKDEKRHAKYKKALEMLQN